MSVPHAGGRRVALVTLGCARNEVDSEELAGRLAADGWELTDSDSADVVMVNTCGFIEQAKKDSIDTLLAASDAARATGGKVVAVGCIAQGDRPERGPSRSATAWGGTPRPRTCRSTAARCCRSRRWSGPPRPARSPSRARLGAR